jgi:hypothetical protein
MADYCQTPAATEYVRALLDTIWPQTEIGIDPYTGPDPPIRRAGDGVDQVGRACRVLVAKGSTAELVRRTATGT